MDLFSGVGGLSYGFSKLHEFNIVAANEIDKDISIAYSLNHPNVKMMNCSIKDLTEDKLSEVIGDKKIDIILGGPPCQSYSTLGKRQMDERANLFMEYKRVLKILNPTAFVFENVAGLLSVQKGELFQIIQKEFEHLGYNIKYQILNAVDYGVPQQRERVILVGMRGTNSFKYPKATHGIGLKPYITLKDAIGDLPTIKPGGRKCSYLTSPKNEFQEFMRANAPKKLTEHFAPKNHKKLIKVMRALKDGESKDDLPPRLRPKSGYGNTYAKLWWEKPSTTITRNFACPSSSRCIHPRDSRAMSIREGARLQSFPDDYKFYGTASVKRLEIGNAVPPILSMAIAKEMLKAINSSVSKK